MSNLENEKILIFNKKITKLLNIETLSLEVFV